MLDFTPLAQQIIDRANRIESSPDLRLPDPGTLAEVLRISFFACLETEERRSLRLSLVLGPPLYSCEREWSEFQFATSRPFTREALVKLAPALDPLQGYLGVDWSEDGREIKIWGVARTGARSHRFGLRQVRQLGITRPDLLWLYVEPGGFHVDVCDSRLFDFVSGEVMEGAVTIFPEENFITRLLFGKTGIQRGPGMILPPPMTLLLYRILEQRHGGAIFFGPERALSGCDLTYTCSPPLDAVMDHSEGFGDLLELDLERARALGAAVDFEHVPYIPDMLESARERENYEDALTFIASLTGVDGAVALDYDFRVHGFGVFVKDVEVPEGHRALDRECARLEPLDFSLLGGRHKSAAAFCASAPGDVAAFVVSEDGLVSAMYAPTPKEWADLGRPDYGGVIVWRPISIYSHFSLRLRQAGDS